MNIDDFLLASSIKNSKDCDLNFFCISTTSGKNYIFRDAYNEKSFYFNSPEFTYPESEVYIPNYGIKVMNGNATFNFPKVTSLSDFAFYQAFQTSYENIVTVNFPNLVEITGTNVFCNLTNTCYLGHTRKFGNINLYMPKLKSIEYPANTFSTQDFSTRYPKGSIDVVLYLPQSLASLNVSGNRVTVNYTL